jgi:hypothetical protein
VIQLNTLSVDGAPYEGARAAYLESGSPLSGWLRLTAGKPAVGRDGTPAPRLDMTASRVIAIEWPAGFGVPGARQQDVYGSPAPLEGLAEVLRGAPVMQLQRGPGDAVLVALLTTPEGWRGQSRGGDGGEIRRLTLDVAHTGIERWRRADDQVGITLPCQGAGCRWAQLYAGAPPECPAELLALLAPSGPSGVELDDVVGEWLVEHFEPSDPGLIEGLITRVAGERRTVDTISREDLHGALLASTGWCASDFSAERLGRLVTTVYGEEVRYRTNAGYRWQLRRRNPAADLPPPASVSTAKLDPLLVALAREIHAARELNPQIKRERVEAAAAAKRAAEAAATVIARWGSQETFDTLRDEGYIAYHQQAEGRRYRAGSQYAVAFTALNFSGATSEFPSCARIELPPEAWQQSPPGTPPAERYKRLVQVYIEGGAK